MKRGTSPFLDFIRKFFSKTWVRVILFGVLPGVVYVILNIVGAAFGDPAPVVDPPGNETLVSMFDEFLHYFVGMPRTYWTRDSKNSDIMNNSISACDDLYEYSCGNFGSLDIEYAETFDYVISTNALKVEFINTAVETVSLEMCDEAHDGCFSALKFYEACKKERTGVHVELTGDISDYPDQYKDQVDNLRENATDVYAIPDRLEQKVLEELPTGTYKQIRHLIENGITNYVHLTKERIHLGDGVQWVHYLRPGGVLLAEKSHDRRVGDRRVGNRAPDKRIKFGDWKALKERVLENQKVRRETQRRHAETIKIVSTVEMFIDEFLEEVGDYDWINVFGENAQLFDTVYVEDFDYFLNLKPTEERTRTYVHQYFMFMDSRSCMDLTKLLFPMTFCTIFNSLGENLLAAESLLEIKKMTNDLYTYIKDGAPRDIEEDEHNFRRSFDDYNVRIGTCSALLHSNNLGYWVYEAENDPTIRTKMSKYKSAMEWAHEHVIKNYYKYYDPMYLFYANPRVLIPGGDPLEWFAFAFAFFDGYLGEIVFLRPSMEFPFYHPQATNIHNYALYGDVVGHEVGHYVQDEYDTECLLDEGVESTYLDEDFADIFGLSRVFEFYMEYVAQDENICDFFVAYAQMRCAAEPSEQGAVHDSPRRRTILPILFGSEFLLNEYNNCFGCSISHKECIN